MIDLLETFENAVFSQDLCWITGFSDSLFLRDKAHERAQLWLLFWAMASRFPADGMDGSLSGSWVGAKKIVSREEKTRSGREKSNMCTTYKNGDLEDCLWMMVAILIIYGLLYTTINDCLPSIRFTHSRNDDFTNHLFIVIIYFTNHLFIIYHHQWMMVADFTINSWQKCHHQLRRSTCPRFIKVARGQIPNRLRRVTSMHSVYVCVYILYTVYVYIYIHLYMFKCCLCVYIYMFIYVLCICLYLHTWTCDVSHQSSIFLDVPLWKG